MAVATYVIAPVVPVKRLIDVIIESNAINNNEAVHSPFYSSASAFGNLTYDESSKDFYYFNSHLLT